MAVTPTTRKINMEIMTNKNGIPYYRKLDGDNHQIYSFSPDFEDIWSDEDESAIEAGTTPSKFTNQ